MSLFKNHLKIFLRHPPQSFPILTIFIPSWFVNNPFLFFHLDNVLSSSFNFEAMPKVDTRPDLTFDLCSLRTLALLPNCSGCTFKVGTHDGISPCDWSLRLVASGELAIFASKSMSRRDQL